MAQLPSSTVAGSLSPTLSASQLATLAELGEERTADVGEVLYEVGDRRYPFIAIRDGEVAIRDAVGDEIVRHGASGFLGELNLLSGQTVFVTAVVTEPLRYIAVERDTLRSLLYEDAALSDLVLAAFISRREALQAVQGLGLEIVGPHSSKATMQLLEFARSNRLPFSWRDADNDSAAGPLVAELDEASLPLVRLPGYPSMASPTTRGSASSTPPGRPRPSSAAPRRVAVVGGGNSAGQAAVWLARGGALVTLLHRRADLRETMSDYLVRELERYGVAVRNHSEIAALHGTDGQLESVTLTRGERLRFSYLFLFLGAMPCTEWLDDAVERDENGFILTGSGANGEKLLETSVPGILAAGDVRSGSTKRCATAVGEGAWAVQLVHAHLAAG